MALDLAQYLNKDLRQIAHSIITECATLELLTPFISTISVEEMINNAVDEIVDTYSEYRRSYHNDVHILNMLSYVLNNKEILNQQSEIDRLALYVAILYHDIVYDPRSNTNEKKSVLLLKKHFSINNSWETQERIDSIEKWESQGFHKKIQRLIMVTRANPWNLGRYVKHPDETPLYKLIVDADYSGFESYRQTYINALLIEDECKRGFGVRDNIFETDRRKFLENIVEKYKTNPVINKDIRFINIERLFLDFLLKKERQRQREAKIKLGLIPISIEAVEEAILQRQLLNEKEKEIILG